MKIGLFPKFGIGFATALLLACAGGSRAQDPAPLAPDVLSQPPRVPFKLSSTDEKDGNPISTPARAPRLQLLGIQAGFLASPLGLDSDDDIPQDVINDSGHVSDDLDFLQLSVGSYNPYLDMHLPGDPGAPGYFKVYSQLQLLDSGSTSLCIGLNTLAPAGLQAGGVANGPTYFVPALACFQDIGFGSALHGYVGQNIQANSRWSDRLNSSFQYGLAVHCPVPYVNPSSEQGLFLYFEALGRCRLDAATAAANGSNSARTSMWEFVPGVQLRVNSSCWMSVGASRYNFLSCNWKY
jgi:hypothetical protein